MIDLLSQLQTHYPSAVIYLIVSPSLWGDLRISQLNTLSSLTESNIKLIEWPVNNGADGYGCGYHPNTTTNMTFGKMVEQRVRNDFQW